MRTGETGLNLIKGFEGLRLNAHYAPTEKWTVGYGHNHSARHGMTVTEHEADQLLKEDVSPIEKVIEETVMAPLNQNEYDALTSLIFNIGEDNFRKSAVLKHLNRGDRLAAAAAFENWTKARLNGELVTLDGLVRRRAAEKSLFLMPMNADIVVPSSDVRPAPECDGGGAAGDLKAVPFSDDGENLRRGRELSTDEREARGRALFAAAQALSGDPSKMIISKIEEKADFGITFGAALAGIFGLAATVLGLTVWLGLEWPAFANFVGLSEDRLIRIFDGLPYWLAGLGAAVVYFVLYIIAKRSIRHNLKVQRNEELTRFRIAE